MINLQQKTTIIAELIGLALTIPYLIYVFTDHLNTSGIAFWLRMAPLVVQLVLIVWNALRQFTSLWKSNKILIMVYLLCLALYAFQFAFGITEATRGACDDVPVCLEQASCGDYDNWIFSILYLLGIAVLLTALSLSCMLIVKQEQGNEGGSVDTARKSGNERSGWIEINPSSQSPTNKGGLNKSTEQLVSSQFSSSARQIQNEKSPVRQGRPEAQSNRSPGKNQQRDESPQWAQKVERQPTKNQFSRVNDVSVKR